MNTTAKTPGATRSTLPAQLRWLANALPLVTLLVLAAYLWRLTAAHDHLRSATLAQTGHHAVQLATVQAAQIETLLAGADGMLRQFRDQYQTGRRDAVMAAVSSGLATYPLASMIDFRASDAQGVVEFSSLAGRGQGHDNIGQADYFRMFAGSTTDRLHIAKPVNGTHGWVLLLTRPMHRQGRFTGVAQVAISARYIADTLARLPIGDKDVSALLFDDGSYLARSREMSQVQGKALPANRPFLGADAPASGVWHQRAHADNRTRLYGWRRLDNYALVQAVGLDEATALAAVEREIGLSIKRNAVALPLVLALVLSIGWLLHKGAAQHLRVLDGGATLRATLDSTTDGILLVAADGQVLDVNERFKQLWNIPEELMAQGRDDALLAHVLDQLVDPQGFMQGVTELYSGALQRLDVLRFKDGRIFERHTRAVALGDRQARLWSFRDVTDLYRHREQLEVLVAQRTDTLTETNARLSDTLFAMDRVGIGIHWVDAATARFLYVNTYIASMVGYPPGELLGMTVPQLDPSITMENFVSLGELVRQAGQLRIESVALCRDGSTIPVEVTICHVPAREGVPTRFISFVTDITERMQHEQALVRAKEQAEAGNASKSAFLANMSHEIRTPLNAITGMTYLLRRDHPTPSQARRLDMIDKAERRLMQLVDAVLDLSHIDGGQLHFEDNPLNIAAVLDQVRSAVAEAARHKGLQVEIEANHAPPWLRGDPTRLHQALLNYAANAVKFTEQGRITLRVDQQDTTDHDVLLRFSVSDPGIGIAPEHVDRLFRAFEQIDISTTRKYDGAGLGLVITQRLAQLMGGSVGVDSRPGAGSTFWFTARLRRVGDDLPARPQRSVATSNGMHTATSTASGATIDVTHPSEAPDAVWRVLDELRPLLDTGDLAALSCVDEHRELLQTSLGPVANILGRQIRQFAFDRASATIAALERASTPRPQARPAGPTA